MVRTSLLVSMTLAGALALTIAAPVVAQRPSGNPPAGTTEIVKQVPPEWLPGDLAPPPARYAVEVAQFPSSALAEGVRQSLLNLGWRPVNIVTTNGQSSVQIGNFASTADAAFVAMELETQHVATPRIVELARGTKPGETEAEGPFLPKYAAAGDKAMRDFDWQKALVRLRGMASNMPEAESGPFKRSLDLLETIDGTSYQGSAATAVVNVLVEKKTEADTALYLASHVARGEWPATDVERLRCREVVADLLYGHVRDWRGAWSASRDLLADPQRNAQGSTRDRLRLAALKVELAGGSSQPKPAWSEIRADLRQAFDATPKEEKRLLARIELVYLQTFAWEGDWNRVESLALAYLERRAEFRSETALARIFLARSLERKEDYQGARDHLGRVIGLRYDDEGFYMGFERLDINALARKWNDTFTALAAGTGSEGTATSTPIPAENPAQTTSASETGTAEAKP